MFPMITLAAILGAMALGLLWWDLVDFVLDRVGPAPARSYEDLMAEGAGPVGVGGQLRR